MLLGTIVACLALIIVKGCIDSIISVRSPYLLLQSIKSFNVEFCSVKF
jgi:hypothetical protein